MISWFVFTLASVDEIAEYAVVHLQRLEDAGKQSANLQTHILALNEFSQRIFFSGRRLLSLNSSFIVYCKRSLALPTSLCWHVFAQPARTRKIWTNREARKKPIRNLLISNAQICPSDSAGYQNELLGTNSQTDHKMVYAIRGPAAKQASLKCATNKIADSVLYR